MAAPPIVALEIGTSKVCALIGEDREDGSLVVTGVGECASAGVRKSEIIDFTTVLACCKEALGKAEEEGQVLIRQVHLVLSGSHIRSDVNRGTVHITDEEREITGMDIRGVGEAARHLHLPPEREILHSISQHYYVDQQPGVMDPEGMEGSQLALDTLIIHGAASVMRNVIRVARTAMVDVQDAAFGGLCAALAVLTREQKAAGVAVIDLGGGTTDYLVYGNQIMARAESIGIGGDHVSNDIVVGLRLPMKQAEQTKVQHGSAVPVPAQRNHTVSLPADGTFPGRTVKLADLHAIVNARMDEMFKIVRADLEARDLLYHLGAGIVLTGGGAQMSGVVELAEKVFNMPCVLGQPRAVSGLSQITGGPAYAAPLGMLRYGIMTRERGGAGPGLKGLLRRIFNRKEGT